MLGRKEVQTHVKAMNVAHVDAVHAVRLQDIDERFP